MVRTLKEEARIDVVDLLEQYKADSLITPENAYEFYWQVDGHHNAKGYAVMGQSIAENVATRQWVDE